MNKIFILIIATILIILFIYASRLIINQTKKTAYLKAGEKWEGIVKELRERK